jgi:hypothetical protein
MEVQLHQTHEAWLNNGIEPMFEKLGSSVNSAVAVSGDLSADRREWSLR